MFQGQALISLVEPNFFAQDSKNNDWINAMNDELDQIEKNRAWELVPRPKGMNDIGTKWIFKNKFNKDGKVIRNKSTLVCKWYDRIEGIEFEDTFVPVVRPGAIRMFLAFVCYKNFKFYQIDVKYAFLNR